MARSNEWPSVNCFRFWAKSILFLLAQNSESVPWTCPLRWWIFYPGPVLIFIVGPGWKYLHLKVFGRFLFLGLHTLITSPKIRTSPKNPCTAEDRIISFSRANRKDRYLAQRRKILVLKLTDRRLTGLFSFIRACLGFIRKLCGQGYDWRSVCFLSNGPIF